MAAAPRQLSDLPDDLLRRILLHASAREAAATAVLSRRWRTLWRASGAAYLDSHYFIIDDRGCSSPEEHGQQSRGWGQPNLCTSCFLHCAEKALAAAAAVPITKLTFLVADHHPTRMDDGLIGAVLSIPLARRVEELHIKVDHRRSSPPLSFGSLPSQQSLRVLSLTNCSPPRPGAAFPRLAELRLHKCTTVPLVDLQHLVGAAPRLAALHLVSSCLSGEKETLPPVAARCYRLVCPAITALVLADCTVGYKVSLELDVPRLQSLRYKGAVQLCHRLSLKPQTSPAPNMMIQQADLHLIFSDRHFDNKVLGRDTLSLSFWQFMKSLSTAKVLKLKLDFSIGRVAMMSQDDNKLLPCRRIEPFRNLERLELDAPYTPGGCVESLVFLATLLHGCPAVRDLRLKLSKNDLGTRGFRSITREARVDFDKSVDRFRRRRSLMRSLGGEDDDTYQAYGNHVLREQSFRCLESCLRRVSLHFRMDDPYCLGLQLARFLAENGRAIEEMYIDDGSQKMCEHMIFSKTRLVKRRGPSIEA